MKIDKFEMNDTELRIEVSGTNTGLALEILELLNSHQEGIPDRIRTPPAKPDADAWTFEQATVKAAEVVKEAELGETGKPAAINHIPESTKMGRPSKLTPMVHDFIKAKRQQGFTARVISEQLRLQKGQTLSASFVAVHMQEVDAELEQERRAAMRS